MAKYLTRAEVLRRMKRGDLPTQGGGYTSALHFDDGSRTTGPLGARLVREGVIDRPKHSSVSSPYTLADLRRCAHCGELEDGGSFGWFDHDVDGLTCNSCGGDPLGALKGGRR